MRILTAIATSESSAHGGKVAAVAAAVLDAVVCVASGSGFVRAPSIGTVIAVASSSTFRENVSTDGRLSDGRLSDAGLAASLLAERGAVGRCPFASRCTFSRFIKLARD